MTAAMSAPCVWLLTDDKPGHRNQLRGLADRLSALSGAQIRWISVGENKPSLWRCWRGVNLAPELPAPALVIAAGSGTQRSLLATGREFGCPTVLLMKPNFPYSWVDAAIVPAHDRPPLRGNVLVTRGVLNAVSPVAELAADPHGLLLIGGVSKHFGWSNAALIEQILALCNEAPSWRWTLTDSRRTPPEFMDALVARAPANLELVAHATTGPEWLPVQLGASRRVWVTPDSVSMVYEALTAGVPTGLFDLPAAEPGRRGRIVSGLQELIEAGLATTFARRLELRDDRRPQLWEADHASRWLLQRFFPKITMKSGNSGEAGDVQSE